MNSFYEHHKKIFEFMKSKALSYETDQKKNSLLSEFEANLYQYSTRSFSSSSLEELFTKIEKSQIIYLGDFHTFDQSVKNLVRFMKTLYIKNTNLIIGLEMIGHDKLEVLEGFMESVLTEREFLEGINYSESWRFPWSHYREIFKFAKTNKIKIIPLNSDGDLEQREEFAADILSNEMKLNADSSVLVLFGEMHITPNKLPRKLKKKSNKEIHQTIIYQNLDEVYWNSILEKDKIDDFQIVKFSTDEYCMISSPPWMKYESLCYWYEGLVSDPEFDIHEYLIANGYKIFSENPADSFMETRNILKTFLELELEEDLFTIYDHQKSTYVKERVSNELFNEYYIAHLESNESFITYDTKVIYCSNYSVNELASLASKEFLFMKFDEKLQSLAFKDKGYFMLFSIYLHSITNLFVKILNPFFKSDLYLDFSKPSNQRRKYIFSKEVIDSKSLPLSMLGLSHFELESVAKLLGGVIAHNIYEESDIDSPMFNLKDFKAKFLDLDFEREILKRFLEMHLFKNEKIKLQEKRVF